MKQPFYQVDGSFLRGFFKACSRHGLDDAEVAELMRRQTAAGLLADPHVSRGFFRGLNKHAAEFPPERMRRTVTPAMVAEALLGPNPDLAPEGEQEA